MDLEDLYSFIALATKKRNTAVFMEKLATQTGGAYRAYLDGDSADAKAELANIAAQIETCETECDTCDADSFADGSDSCAPCPKGTTSARGATTRAQCTVAPGFYGAPGKAATACPWSHSGGPAGSISAQNCWCEPMSWAQTKN